VHATHRQLQVGNDFVDDARRVAALLLLLLLLRVSVAIIVVKCATGGLVRLEHATLPLLGELGSGSHTGSRRIRVLLLLLLFVVLSRFRWCGDDIQSVNEHLARGGGNARPGNLEGQGSDAARHNLQRQAQRIQCTGTKLQIGQNDIASPAEWVHQQATQAQAAI
jgi:hypothetical protein